MKQREVGFGSLGLVGLALVGLAGCSSAPAPPEGGPVPAAEAETPEPAQQAPPQAEAESGPAIGLYTAAQAERGAEVYENVCSECHTTSEFGGRSFQADWGRRSVYSLYRTVRSTMPDDNPGGLEDQVYLDVIAYILGLNGHGEGPAELTAESPMRDVRIDPATSGSQR